MRYRVSVRVMPKTGISDPEGKAIHDAAHQLGYREVDSVHAGKSFEVEGDYASEAAARDAIGSLAERLLANPVIETFVILDVEELK
ncbi:MAG: phosphoribosylformylglycinamidine synthase subunit PurS [Ferrimicrobium sp.]|jgi:phosphoribosylformylglycinamidine synthase|nr:phosphoribosylformylglycinamidine synthase subunit PurS [Ferrimicrobium sp.]